MVRRVKRASRKTRKMRGGWQRLNPASVNDESMAGPTKMSNAQGQEYDALHEGQHGGGLGEGAPVGDTGMLDAALRVNARVTPIDNSISAIQGMSDQAGGRHGGSRRGSRRHGGSRRRNGGSRRRNGGSRRRNGGSRRRNGGSKRRTYRKRQGGGSTLMPASADAPGMILPGSAGAERGMNPEWKLAHDPTSFIPNAVKASVAAL